MKNIIMIFSLFFSIALMTNNQEAKAQNNEKTYDEIAVTVEGLGCPFCAYGLEKKFKEFKGIKNVNIDMETGLFTFSYPSDKALSLEQIANQVEEAGYTAVHTKIERASGEIEDSGANSVTEEIQEESLISESIFVFGNCGMCKARIDNTASKIVGVTNADWNKKSKMLDIEFDESLVSLEEIEAAIARVGHDTKNAKTDQETYDNLPGCCQYDREQ